MRTPHVGKGLLASALLALGGAAEAQTPAADSVAHLDQAWARSYAVHDTALALGLFAPDLVVVGGRGALKDREGEMRDVRPQAGLTMHFFRTRDVQIRCYPGTCAAVGVAEWEFEYNGRVDATRRRYSASWVRGGPMGWQMVTLHISPELGPQGGT